MVRGSKPDKGQLQGKDVDIDFDAIEIADEEIEAISEIGIPRRSFISGSVTRIKETIARTHLGQFALRKFDGILRVLEDTAKWSLPQDDGRIKLRRPLPWPVTPQRMVDYFRNKRRELRAIRVQGLKAIESRKNRSPDGSARTSGRIAADKLRKDNSFLNKLKRLFTGAIYRRRQNPVPPTRRIFSQNVKEAASLAERSAKRARDDDDDAIRHLTVSELLDKYASESSDNDPDYIPKEGEEEDDDDEDEGSSTPESSTSSSGGTLKKSTGSEDDSSGDSQKTLTDKQSENVSENGESKYEPKRLALTRDQYEIHVPAESENEQMQASEEGPEKETVPAEAEGQPTENPTADIEVANKSSAVITNQTRHNQQGADRSSSSKFTPDHESAPPQESSSSTTPNAAQTSTAGEANPTETFTTRPLSRMAAESLRKNAGYKRYYNYKRIRKSNR